MKYLINGFWLCWSLLAFSQQVEIDSIKKQLNVIPPKSEAYQTIVDDACQKGQGNVRYKNFCTHLKVKRLFAEKKYSEALELSKAELNANKTLNTSEKYSFNYFVRSAYYKQREVDSIIKYSKKMLEYADTPDRKLYTLSILGQIYAYKNDYNTAFNYFKDGLPILDSVKGDKPKAEFYLYYANAQYKNGLYKFCLENLNHAITHIENAGRKDMTYANALKIKGRTYRRIKQLDSATIYYKKALAVYKEQNMPNSIASVYDDLSHVLIDAEDYDEALETALKGYDIKQENNLSKGFQYSHSHLGRLYYLISPPNLNKSLFHLNKAKALAQNTEDVEDQASINFYLYNAYRKTKQYDSAYAYVDAYIKFRDSFTSIKKDNLFADLDTKYKSEQLKKKLLQEQLSLQEALNKEQTRVNQILILVISILVLLGFVYWIRKKYVGAEKRYFNIYMKHRDLIRTEGHLKKKLKKTSGKLKNNKETLAHLISKIEEIEHSNEADFKKIKEEFHKNLQSKYHISNSIFRVWVLMAYGNSYKEISKILSIEEQSAKKYRTRLYNKIDHFFDGHSKSHDAIKLYWKEQEEYLKKRV